MNDFCCKSMVRTMYGRTNNATIPAGLTQDLIPITIRGHRSQAFEKITFYAYIADGDAGLQVVEISNSPSPTSLRDYGTSAQAVTLYGSS